MSVRRLPSARPSIPYGELGLSLASTAGSPVTVLRVAGELDVDTVALLTEPVKELVRQRTAVLLMLDLERLTFFGAAGITALLTVRQLLDARGGHLILGWPAAHVLRVLTMAHLLDLFDIKGAAAP